MTVTQLLTGSLGVSRSESALVACPAFRAERESARQRGVQGAMPLAIPANLLAGAVASATAGDSRPMPCWRLG